MAEAKKKQLTGISWEDFKALSPADKVGYLSDDERILHVLLAQQFDRKRLDEIGHLATCVRRIAKSEDGMTFLQRQLSHKRAMLYFTQPSSRTFLSFCAACQILGMQIGEVRDASVSSEFKGESREDSVRTFSSYFDLIVMRTELAGFVEKMAWIISNSERTVPVINAGSAKDQHPTQALLDIYTLQRSFEKSGGIDGKTVLFVGDLARGRTVRSLSSLLTRYCNVRQIFVAPPHLQIGEDILADLRASGISHDVRTDLEPCIPEADAIYMTRIQREWDAKVPDGQMSFADTQMSLAGYSFGLKHLSMLKDGAVLMHPFPRTGEISPEVDHDHRAVYWRQMRNGMWARVALIAGMFAKDSAILDYYNRLPGDK
ncbi:MAG: aspartate carbamoyltransferase [bacterium]